MEQGQDPPSGKDTPTRPLRDLSILRYNSPLVQVAILGLICFSLPGMFNALNGLGDGGKSDPTITDNANTALSVSFAVCSFFAGCIFNVMGPQLMLLLGGLTYALYVFSYIIYKAVFVVVAGGLLGIGAGFLWAAQGAIMLSYPEEANKGRYFGLFWGIYNCGATIGSLLALVLQWNSGKSSVSKPTYVVFVVIMVMGSLLSLVLLPSKKVIRNNREPVSIRDYSPWRREVVEIFKLLRDWRMRALSPLFLCSNWYYTYEFNCLNGGGYFTTRTRAMNAFVYFVAQIIGSTLMGFFMDSKLLVSKSRRTRAVMGLTLMLFIATSVWGGAFSFQQTFTRASLRGLTADARLDLMDSDRYVGPVILYSVLGMFDAMLATYIYWILGALTNDAQTAARFVGYFKCVQNVGAALAGQIDAKKVSYLVQLIVNWALITVGVLTAYFVAFHVTETSSDDKDAFEELDGDTSQKAPGVTPDPREEPCPNATI